MLRNYGKSVSLKSFLTPPRRVIILVVLSFLAISFLSAQTTYDRNLVVKVMRQNAGLLGEIRGALGKNDFWAAAQGFWKFAEGMESISKMAPPKGSKAEWEAQVGEFVSVALKGVGAAGEKDGAKASQFLAELQALNKKGHTAFR